MRPRTIVSAEAGAFTAKLVIITSSLLRVEKFSIILLPMNISRLAARWLVCILGLVLGACETAPPMQRAPERNATASAFARPPKDRPGLGTRWGETRQSPVAVAAFQRAHASRPFAVAAIYYDDAAGIPAMASNTPLQRTWPVLPGAAGRLLSVGLRDESGRFLPGLIVGDRWFVVGEEGRRYSIVVRNNSALRLEVVLSVDGLDVLDGRAASFHDRGYVIQPHDRLTVAGFRQSAESVAAFRFSPVRESYAHEKYGRTRDVGVIGLAVFDEIGSNLPDDREARRRLNANPFPGGFATPP